MTLIFIAEFPDRISVVTDTALTRPTDPCPPVGGALKACVDGSTQSGIAWAGSFDMSPCAVCPSPSLAVASHRSWDLARDDWLARLNAHANVHAPPGGSALVAVLGFDGTEGRAAILKDHGAARSWRVEADRTKLPIAIGYLEPLGLHTGRDWASIDVRWKDVGQFERWATERIAAAQSWLEEKRRCVVVATPVAVHHVHK